MQFMFENYNILIINSDQFVILKLFVILQLIVLCNYFYFWKLLDVLVINVVKVIVSATSKKKVSTINTLKNSSFYNNTAKSDGH